MSSRENVKNKESVLSVVIEKESSPVLLSENKNRWRNLHVQPVNPEDSIKSKDDKRLITWEEFYREITNRPRIQKLQRIRKREFTDEDYLSLLDVQKKLVFSKNVELDKILKIILKMGNGCFQGKFSSESFFSHFQNKKITAQGQNYVHLQKLDLINELLSLLEEELTVSETVDLLFTNTLEDFPAKN
ncbi:hypothetical protein NGRA_0191 [Nosema granulosis]|uniref:Uncharacterized protein n=1 Tax=Nosema granulosis TaxID=83296 RepID=A0A9P6L0K4_9MICR|nr:hypothetical protein NGRA_0191 [Nosema granulosis]